MSTTSDTMVAGTARQGVPLVLLGSLVITGIGQTLLYALLPLASRALSMSGQEASAVFALSSIFWSAFSPVWGRIADRSGGTWVMMLGMAGQALSNAAVGVVLLTALQGRLPHHLVFPLLLGLRGINGVLGSAVLPSAQGMALRAAPDRPRIALIGTVATCWAVGTMSGPGFAAGLAAFGLATPLFVAAGLALCAAAVMAGQGSRPGVVMAAAPQRAAMRRLIRRRIWPFMAMGLAIGTANSIVAQVTGFFVQDRLGVSEHRAVALSGISLSLVAGAAIAAQTAAIRLRPRPSLLMALGALAVGSACAAIVLMPVPGVLLGALAVAGAGLGAASLGISTSASLMMRPGQQGAVAGSLASASSLGALVSALAVMPFYERMPDFPYLAAGALAAAVLLASPLAPRPRPER